MYRPIHGPIPNSKVENRGGVSENRSRTSYSSKMILTDEEDDVPVVEGEQSTSSSFQYVNHVLVLFSLIFSYLISVTTTSPRLFRRM